jgi:hypothetical protein
MRYFVTLAVILALACAAPLRTGRSLTDGPVEFQTILAGSHSLADTAYVELVTNGREWENVWLIAKGKEQPLPAIPTVNFSHQYVIAAFMGERNSSGYRIEISSVQKRGNILDVHVKKYETPGMLPVMTNPFCLVRLPRGRYRLQISEETIR